MKIQMKEMVKRSGLLITVLKLKNALSTILNFFKVDYSSGGERQASKSFLKIRPDHRARYKKACEFINDNDIILDCACGVGYGSKYMAMNSNCKRVVSIDINKKAIIYAKKYYNHEKVQYFLNDILKINRNKFPEKFDVIVSFETIEHLDGDLAMKIFYKFLNPGGTIIISTPNQKTLPYTSGQFPFHLRHYTPDEFSDMIVTNGFRIVHKYSQNDSESEEVSDGWNGLFNIAVAEKI